jgi:hypothetical protein
MRALAFSVPLALMLGATACGGRQTPSRGVDADDAIFYIKSNVNDANVFVDGRFIGPVTVLKGGIAVEPGKHRLELRHEDYFSRYVDLDLKKAERKKLLITLAPVLP